MRRRKKRRRRKRRGNEMCSEKVGVTIIMNRTKYEYNVIYSTLHYRAIQFLYRVDEYHASKYTCNTQYQHPLTTFHLLINPPFTTPNSVQTSPAPSHHASHAGTSFQRLSCTAQADYLVPLPHPRPSPFSLLVQHRHSHSRSPCTAASVVVSPVMCVWSGSGTDRARRIRWGLGG